MPRSGDDSDALRAASELICKADRTINRRGSGKNGGVRDDSHEAAQNEIGHSESHIGVDQFAQPIGISIVIGRIPTKCVDQHIDVNEKHGLGLP